MKFRIWLTLGILSELILLGYCYTAFDDVGEVFRHCARYSGRISLFAFLACTFLFAKSSRKELYPIKQAATLFCVLHFIHFGFLATNIYLNEISLVPVKLAGGFLAYALILVYPFVIDKVKPSSLLHYIYFYYVGAVIAITYVARIKGDFEGASPETFHYFGLVTIVTAMLGLTLFLILKKKAHKPTI